jgi:hypothetical protein
VIFRRGRFRDVVTRQLDLFVRDHAGDIEAADERLRLYEAADRDEAEELYGDYVDEVDGLVDLLVEMRTTYGATLSEDDALRYGDEFARAARRRLARFDLDLG